MGERNNEKENEQWALCFPEDRIWRSKKMRFSCAEKPGWLGKPGWGSGLTGSKEQKHRILKFIFYPVKCEKRVIGMHIFVIFLKLHCSLKILKTKGKITVELLNVQKSVFGKECILKGLWLKALYSILWQQKETSNDFGERFVWSKCNKRINS